MLQAPTKHQVRESQRRIDIEIISSKASDLLLVDSYGLQCTCGRQVHVLLIAVADYQAAGLDPLRGPTNDIALMDEVLQTRFNVPTANIRKIFNPTHTAIGEEFTNLAKRVQRNDLVYIHFSGHGSYAPAPDGPRKEDQTWVPYGARVANQKGNDRYDVLDKEIGHWLQPLYALTKDVVFVSDSCHSASVTKGDRAGVRQAQSVGMVHPLRESLSPLPPVTDGLRIGAARDYEAAVEVDVRDVTPCNESESKHCYGIFTWNWSKALRASQPGDSWGSVFPARLCRDNSEPSD